MEDSAMDMTAVCSSNNRIKSEFSSPKDNHELLLQENHELKNKVEVLERINKELENEMINQNIKCGKSDLDLSVSFDFTSSKAVFQENYELKKRIDVLEKLNMDLECEINYSTQKQAKETTKLLSIQEELDNANSKIRRLESCLEEERMQTQRMIQYIEEIKEAPGTKSNVDLVVVPDQEQLNILTLQIEKLEIQREDDQSLMRELAEEKDILLEKLSLLNGERQALQNELSDIKELLNQKTIDLRNLNITLESVREEKLVMQGEIQLLKASDKNATRGNSLFAEVEDNRQKVAAQRECLKIKYLNLKKLYNQKQAENNKLKTEIMKIRREEKEDEKSVHHDCTTLIDTYKQRVLELEERVKELENKAETQPIFQSDKLESDKLWINSVIEDERNKTRALQEELDRRSSNYVTQGHQLLASQRENRKLKSTVSKLQSDIDELRLQLEKIKLVQENLEDGISPPATDVAVEYQKQKMVRFKEALSEQVRNNSKNNSSSTDADTSVSEQSKSSKEVKTFRKGVQDNKENLSS